MEDSNVHFTLKHYHRTVKKRRAVLFDSKKVSPWNHTLSITRKVEGHKAVEVRMSNPGEDRPPEEDRGSPARRSRSPRSPPARRRGRRSRSRSRSWSRSRSPPPFRRRSRSPPRRRRSRSRSPGGSRSRSPPYGVSSTFLLRVNHFVGPRLFQERTFQDRSSFKLSE